MANLIGYKNKLWKVIHDFKCTGTDQPFTLDPGKYLFICKGATSGEFVGNNALKPEMGGLVMGIQNVTEQTTFHAVVGGKGGDLTDTSSISLGGFNGGMPGSKSMTPAGSWRNGCGGGGASDIRLLPYDPDEYPTFTDDGHLIEPQEAPVMLHDNEYIQLEYIRCVGNRRRNGSSNMAYLNTGYNPKISSKIVYDGVVYSTKSVNSLEFYTSALFGILNGDSRRCAFFARIAQDGEVGYERYDKTKHSLDFTFDQRMKIVAYDTKVEWFVNDISMGDITLDDPVTRIDDLSSTLYIFGRNREGGLDCYGPNTQLYSFKIYEVDETNQTETLAMNLLPVQRVSDNTIGMFDTVSETFLTFTNADQGVIPGPKKRLSPSLYSRIMVAGGAGGLFYRDTIHGAQFGGGVIGSFVWGNGDYEPNCEMIPNQTNGYAFGYGQRAVDSNSTYSWSPEGSSSGGGGWYGGYARIGLTQTSNMHMPGGGGSGYVLTSSSYRPDGYTPDAKYNFTDTFMSCGQSHEGEVIIASLVTSYSQGDIIEFPSVASMQSIDVSPGKYKLKCYGGDGGYARYFFEAARGGYSEGIINILSNKTLYVKTGGSGNPRYFYPLKFDIHSQLIDYVPNISYNGGGTPINGTNIWDRVSGGGATDIRIDGNTLNHRIIVAGGAGSSGGWQHVDGGVGGGLTGGSVNDDYSANAGPGTQTGSRQSDTYPDISGSFGQGGHGMQTGSHGFGGSGGGGWYGGSGSHADYDYQYHYMDASAGAGGSGYVLTETSYKPSGYQVDNSDYYLQDASTTSGGNSLPLFETKATIEVLELRVPTLACDEEGYKYYDESQKLWILMDTQPANITKHVFDQYPNSFFETDNGLLNEYTLYVYDETDQFNNIDLMVTPPPQIITNILETDSNINQVDYNYDGDPASFKFKTLTSERIDDTHIQIKTCIEKTKPTDEILSLYTATITSSGKTRGPHRYINPDGKRDYYRYDKESGEIVHERRKFAYRDPDDYKDEYGRVMTAQWLLQLGIGNRIPIKYRNDVIDTNVNLIGSTMFAEYQRRLYCAMIVRYTDSSNAYLVIKGMNLITGELTQVYKQQWNSIFSSNNGGTLGGFLVDEEYFYVIDGYVYDYNAFMYKINKSTFDISKTPNASTPISPRSNMQWYQGSILFATYRNIELYHPSSNTIEIFANHSSSDYTIYDICVGEKYMIATRDDSYIYIIDLNTRNVISRNIGLAGILRVCYDDKTHTFYIASNAHIHPFDEETLELGEGITISPITTPTKAFYINDAVIVTNENSNRLVIYRIDQKNYLSIFLPWTIPSYDRYTSGMFIPYMINGYFFYLYQTLAMLQYEGYAKYNMGYKYNKYILEYNIQHASDITCSDDTFFDIRDTCVTITNGTISYNLSTHVNHIASTTIQKSDYGFLLSTGMS